VRDYVSGAMENHLGYMHGEFLTLPPRADRRYYDFGRQHYWQCKFRHVGDLEPAGKLEQSYSERIISRLSRNDLGRT